MSAGRTISTPNACIVGELPRERLMADLKVGDVLWRFDQNCRVYPTDAAGKTIPGGPIYSRHFRPVVIIGETRGTWLVGDHGRWKVNKKTLRTAKDADGWHVQMFTKEQMDDMVYVNDHALPLSEKVRSCRNVMLLKQIAQLFQDGANSAKTETG
jgi:hypothetical protein